jgi:hypothetical protein
MSSVNILTRIPIDSSLYLTATANEGCQQPSHLTLPPVETISTFDHRHKAANEKAISIGRLYLLLIKIVLHFLYVSPLKEHFC